ncbi:hypothetical protein BC938DRAFT_476560, partial [Jimgerdemannia flammicorona]
MASQEELDFFIKNKSPTPVAFFKKFNYKTKKAAVSRWNSTINTVLANHANPRLVEIHQQYKKGIYKEGIDAYFSNSPESILDKEKNSVDKALSKKTGYAIRRRIDGLLPQNSTNDDAEQPHKTADIAKDTDKTPFDEYNSSLVMEDETIEVGEENEADEGQQDEDGNAATSTTAPHVLKRLVSSENCSSAKRKFDTITGETSTPNISSRPEVESEITDNPSNQDFWHTDFEDDLYVLELDLLPEEERVMLEEEEGTKTKQDWKKWGTDLRRAAKMSKHKH